MMALKSPLVPSPNTGMMSAFSPYSDSPTSPQRFGSPTSRPKYVLPPLQQVDTDGDRSSEYSKNLLPPNNYGFAGPTSNPSDIADPSPISTSSNGTDTTHIDDTAIENEHEEPTPEPPKPAKPGLEVILGMGRKVGMLTVQTA